MNKYPTKEEILTCAASPSKDDIELLRFWKSNWNKIWIASKITNHGLVDLIALFIKSDTIITRTGKTYCYVPRVKVIQINVDRPSIISTLHEIGHAKFGNSELQACAWSVKLFKEVFPKAYAKLEWHSHMLKKGKSHGLK